MSIFNYKKGPGYFQRLKEALQVTKQDLGDQIDQIMGTGDSPITEEQLEDLESLMISADLGVETTLEIVGQIREATRQNRFVTSFEVRRILRRELMKILETAETPHPPMNASPHVILVVGVNGVGKTTTIGKLVSLYQKEGHEVLICASDTFRAAAVEQLVIWAERAGADIVRQGQGADPAAVLFDAIASAKARRKDVLIVDTAGRLHTKSNLMQELNKMNRVASREVEGAPHEVYLVLDATTGQNGLIQAREFLNSSGVSGLIITKLDGTAKGGIVVAVSKELKIPVRYIGVGEGQQDLLPFSAEAFVDSLLETEKASR